MEKINENELVYSTESGENNKVKDVLGEKTVESLKVFKKDLENVENIARREKDKEKRIDYENKNFLKGGKIPDWRQDEYISDFRIKESITKRAIENSYDGHELAQEIGSKFFLLRKEMDSIFDAAFEVYIKSRDENDNFIAEHTMRPTSAAGTNVAYPEKEIKVKLMRSLDEEGIVKLKNEFSKKYPVILEDNNLFFGVSASGMDFCIKDDKGENFFSVEDTEGEDTNCLKEVHPKIFDSTNFNNTPIIKTREDGESLYVFSEGAILADYTPKRPDFGNSTPYNSRLGYRVIKPGEKVFLCPIHSIVENDYYHDNEEEDFGDAVEEEFIILRQDEQNPSKGKLIYERAASQDEINQLKESEGVFAHKAIESKFLHEGWCRHDFYRAFKGGALLGIEQAKDAFDDSSVVDVLKSDEFKKYLTSYLEGWREDYRKNNFGESEEWGSYYVKERGENPEEILEEATKKFKKYYELQ